EGVLDVAVGAVVVAAVVDVGQIQQGVAAAVGQLLQAEGQLLPQFVGVEGLGHAGHGVVVAETARVGGGGRDIPQRIDQFAEAGDGLGGIGAERAVGGLRA